MKLQQVISSGKNFKRSSKDMWLKTVEGKITTTGAMSAYELNSEDILAYDWEIEEDSPTGLDLSDNFSGEGSIQLINDAKFGTHIYTTEYGVQLNEESIDKILTFLYNNTEIGKSRITPF